MINVHRTFSGLAAWPVSYHLYFFGSPLGLVELVESPASHQIKLRIIFSCDFSKNSLSSWCISNRIIKCKVGHKSWAAFSHYQSNIWRACDFARWVPSRKDCESASKLVPFSCRRCISQLKSIACMYPNYVPSTNYLLYWLLTFNIT